MGFRSFYGDRGRSGGYSRFRLTGGLRRTGRHCGQCVIRLRCVGNRLNQPPHPFFAGSQSTSSQGNMLMLWPPMTDSPNPAIRPVVHHRL